MNLDRSRVTRAGPLAPIATRGVVATFVAVGLNAVVLAMGRWVLPVPSGFEFMQWQPVLETTAAATLGGTVTYALLDRVTERTDGYFLLVAAVVLMASFLPLVSDVFPHLPGTLVGFVALLHVVVAVVTVGAFVGWHPPEDG